MLLGTLSGDELMGRLLASRTKERGLLVDFIELLIEADVRRFDLLLGCSSLHDLCVRKLKMSGGSAYRRINAARLVQRFPFLLAKIASGELHLSALALLRPYLTDETIPQQLADEASGRPESEIQELLARRFPRADVPERVAPFWGSSHSEPLSPSTYLVQLTVSAATHAKLLAARDLVSHRVPDGNLAAVVDIALDALLKSRGRGRATRPGKAPGVAAGSRHVSAAVRREVFERDAWQCTYTSASGDRCPARVTLQLDHRDAFARGGEGLAANLRVLCKAHNLLHAERTFGEGYVAEKIAVERVEREVYPARDGGDATPLGAGQLERAVEGLTRLGFARPACERAVRAILQGGETSLDLVALMQSAIVILGAEPRRVRRRGPAPPLRQRASG